MKPPRGVGGPAGGAERRRAGLTLLELLLVVAILALAAMGMLRLAGGTEDRTARDLVRVEMREVRKALLQFRKDTGFLPRTGPFACVSQGGRASPPPGLDHPDAWAACPANLVQLCEEPRDAEGEPVMPWDPDTGRGWRGPYLRWDGEGAVDLGAGLDSRGEGCPESGPLLTGVPAVADPFVHPQAGPVFVWRPLVPDPAGPTAPLLRGRPYYLFEPEVPERARLVSSGPDGVYESQDLADPGGGPARIGDDVVLFLFR